MSSRVRIVALTVAVLASAGVVATLLAAIWSGNGDGPAAEVTDVQGSGFEGPRSEFKGALRPAVRAKDFSLRDQDGRLVRLKARRGKVVVLAPMYTTCQDTCPLVAQQIRAALDDLGTDRRQDAEAFALSVDPANDTPKRARRFLLTRRVRGYLDFLLGSRGELHGIWEAYGFSPQTEESEHNSWVVLIDRRGRQRVGFPVNHLTPEALAHDLRLLMDDR